MVEIEDQHSGGSGEKERRRSSRIIFTEPENAFRKRFMRELIIKGGVHEFEPDIHALENRITGITRILESGLPLDLFVSDIQALTMKFHSCLHLDDFDPDKLINSHNNRISTTTTITTSTGRDAREMLEKEREELMSQLVVKLNPFRKGPTTDYGTTIYVAYLSPSLDDNGLIHLFSPFGHIVSAQVIKDQVTGLGKGYGFVEFADLEHAYDAVKHMNFVAPLFHHPWTTPIYVIRIAKPPPPGPPPPLPPFTLHQLLMQCFSSTHYGECFI